MDKISRSVINVVGIVLESYRSNILQRISSFEGEKKSKIIQILDYFLRDIIIGSLKSSLDSQHNSNRSIAETIDLILQKYVSSILVRKYGVVDKNVNGSFFLEPYSYDSDVKFLILVSESEVEYQKIMNKYVLQNSNKISKTLVSLIQIPLETTNLTPQQEEVRKSILEELGDNPVTKFTLDFLKEQITYAFRSNIDTFTNTAKTKVYDYVVDRVLNFIGSAFGRIFKRRLVETDDTTRQDLVLTTQLQYRNNYTNLLTESTKGSVGKMILKAFFRFLKDMFIKYAKRNKLKVTLILSFLMLVLYSLFSAMFRIVKFVFKIVRFILKLPFRIIGKFFKKENLETKLIEDVLYNKKKKEIYYDSVRRITILGYLYEELT